jgi:hypothetical protein
MYIPQWQKTAMHWAAYCGADEVICLLARRGVDLFPRDFRNRTPADVAREKHFMGTAKLIHELAEVRPIKQAKFLA